MFCKLSITIVTIATYVICQLDESEAQLHSSNGGPLQVECYNCNDHTRQNLFPLCLSKPVQCHVGHSCHLRYEYNSDEHPVSSCARDCLKYTSTSPHCRSGGVPDSHGVCHVCCQDSACVSNVTNALHLEMLSSKNLFCPGACRVDNLQDCIDSGHLCDQGDFCMVRIDHQNRLSGHCRSDLLYQRCLTDKERVPCPVNITDPNEYSHDAKVHCYHDCCNTNQCLYAHFGLDMAHAFIVQHPTASPAPTSSSGSANNSLWEQLHGSCQDQFGADLCASLKNDHGVCRDRLSISLCPETCGVCNAINSAVCKDTNVDCDVLKEEYPNYCQETQAALECPTTCNRCTELIDSIVMSIIYGNYTAPASTLQPEPTPGTVINCADIVGLECSIVDPMCEATFLNVLCPKECKACDPEMIG